MKVFIDAGHGGKDPGAVGFGIKEKDISLQVSLKLKEILQRQGFAVDMTRTTDIYVPYQEIGGIANSKGSDIFISVHCNAFNGLAKGTEVLYHPNSIAGIKLARCINESICSDKTLYTLNRKLKPRTDLAVLNSTKMPAVLVELAFIDQSDDNKILQTKKQEFAQVIAKGICKYLRVEYKEKYKLEKAKFSINGKIKELDRILVDGTNYVNIRDLEKNGLVEVMYDAKQNIPILNNVKK